MSAPAATGSLEIQASSLERGQELLQAVQQLATRYGLSACTVSGVTLHVAATVAPGQPVDARGFEDAVWAAASTLEPSSYMTVLEVVRL